MLSVRRLLACAVAVTASLSLAAPVVAHSANAVRDAGARHFKLDRSEPAQGGTVITSPAQLRFWFTQKPVLKMLSVKLTGPAAKDIALGAAWASDSNAKVVSLAVKERLADGAYAIVWRAMANDGHAVNGRVAFTVRSTPAPKPAQH